MASQEVQQSPGAKPGFFYGYIVVMAASFIMVASAIQLALLSAPF